MAALYFSTAHASVPFLSLFLSLPVFPSSTRFISLSSTFLAPARRLPSLSEPETIGYYIYFHSSGMQFATVVTQTLSF